MNGLFRVEDTLANKISYYHLMLLLASLPFNMFYSHIILVSYALHTLIHLNKKQVKGVFSFRTVALQSVFFVTVLSTIYTINKPEAFNEWGKQITILLIPVLFCLNPIDIKKYRNNLFLAFSLVCTGTIAYLYLDAFITIKHYHLPWSNILTGAFTNHNFSEPIDMHATFFSMQVLLALTYLLTLIIKEARFYNRLLYLFCCLVLTAGLIQLSSKSILAVLLITLNIAIPLFLLNGRARLKFMLTAGCFSVLAIVAVLNTNVFRERYVTELKIDMTRQTVDEVSDSRLARWGVTAGLIKKSPFIGYGAGSEIGLLQDGFYTHKLYDSYLNKLNTHSEYLSITLKSGLIGLLIYLATLAFGFKRAILQKDTVFFTFMLLIAVVSFSENLLDVDKGIIFYAFFFSFFAFPHKKQEKVATTDRIKSARIKADDLVVA